MYRELRTTCVHNSKAYRLDAVVVDSVSRFITVMNRRHSLCDFGSNSPSYCEHRKHREKTRIRRFGARFDGLSRGCYDQSAGWSSLVARWAHNPKVGGSNPHPATNLQIFRDYERSPQSQNH